MGIIHFLNVKDGDCTWIEHVSGHNTIIDICNGNASDDAAIMEQSSILGNYNQKNHPVNPIEYLNERDVKKIFRFILTHPDMDHMDGIKTLFDQFDVLNFWDTQNKKEMNDNSDWGRFNKEDWKFYQSLRKSEQSLKVLHLYANSRGKYYNEDEDGESGADGLYILAPTKELIKQANQSGDYNDCSYVILYKTGRGRKVIFAGDSAEKTWDYILENHEDDVTDVDILIAPHHGRKSGGNDYYLDILNPELTLFGNAKSKDLDYASWHNRKLHYITNNQAGSVIADTSAIKGIDIYVTNGVFAKKKNPNTYYNKKYQGWYIITL